MRTAVILVGGNATRANGQPKCQFMLGDKSFLVKQIEELRLCTDEIIVVARDQEQIKNLPKISGIIYVHDIRKGQGPSGGIHAGAVNARAEYFFVTACDMPFLSCKVISFLFDQASGYNAAVPVWDDGKYEPLCAVYCRSAVHNFYNDKHIRRLSFLVEGIQSRLIPVSRIQAIDAERNVFLNINDLTSLSHIQKD
ncbi:MAG: molybdenum cofactor guanylyltransferase [Methanomicrobiales archaeon]|mgnify:CR=1 FL=1|nr:molybdenum cofactor guanylyltransferase [Methanomicrobiales archaeon]